MEVGMAEVGAEIRRLREAKGWTGAQLAVYAGMAPSAVSQIETGRRNPNSGSLAKIAKALEVEVRDLFPKGQAPLPLEGGKLMDRPEVQEWLREQGHMTEEEFLSWAEDLEFEIDDEGIPEGIECGVQDLLNKRNELTAALDEPDVRNMLFPRRSGLATREERIKEAFRPGKLAWKLATEIRYEYLTREVTLANYSKRLYAEGKTSDYLVYGSRDSEYARKRHEALEASRQESYVEAVAV
jgi:transcriptional regulator with XRE-family HTH domain